MRKSLLVVSAIMLASGATAALASPSSTQSERPQQAKTQSELQTKTPAEFCRWHSTDTRYDMYCSSYNE